MVTLGSAAIYVAAAGIVVVEVLSVHSVIYRETHIQSSFCSTCPEKFEGTIGISQSPSRELRL